MPISEPTKRSADLELKEIQRTDSPCTPPKGTNPCSNDNPEQPGLDPTIHNAAKAICRHAGWGQELTGQSLGESSDDRLPRKTALLIERSDGVSIRENLNICNVNCCNE